MTTTDDHRCDAHVERTARKQLRADEAALTGPRKRQVTLPSTFGAFWRHPSRG